MSKKIIVNNEDGSNHYLTITEVSRLYCAYGNNTNTLQLTQNEWKSFSYPSTPINVYRIKYFTVHPTLLRFTYTGSTPKWINISVVCNILKANGNTTSRDIQVQWYLNGQPTGVIRQSHMSTSDCQIISGNGQLLMNQNDYIEPWICNIENSDDCTVWNCSFDLKEDPQYLFSI